MKKAKVLTAVLICLFALSSMTIAADLKKGEKQKVRQITGEIVTLDLKEGTLMVKSKRQEIMLETDDKTKVRFDKEKKKFADLKTGDRVRAKYIQVNGKNRAKSIAIRSSTTATMK